MSESRFVYSIYIQTTPDKLWDALTRPEFTRSYFFETWQDCDWQPGASWKMKIPDGRIADQGEVIEIDPPRKLVLAWRHELSPDLRAEGFSRMTYNVEQQDDAVKLTVIHELDLPESKLIAGVSEGWPAILSSLKTLLETGTPLAMTTKWPEGM